MNVLCPYGRMSRPYVHSDMSKHAKYNESFFKRQTHTHTCACVCVCGRVHVTLHANKNSVHQLHTLNKTKDKGLKTGQPSDDTYLASQRLAFGKCHAPN